MTNSSNYLIVYKILDNDLIGKVSMNIRSLLNCNSIDDFLSALNSSGNELRYFDEEEEMIFIVKDIDFVMFKKIVATKQFLNNEVFVLCSNSKLNKKKYGTVDKIRSMEVEINAIQSESVSVSDQKSARKSKKSSELSVYPQNSEIPKKSKRLLSKSGRLYSAVIEKELNYLPGSEISDGQTICKKWKIRNTGSKKWKENTIQCILLPTEFRDWVYFEPINVPSCYVDQKVVAEMVIQINGKWSDKQMSSEYCCQNINLKWLLFSNKLISESSLKLHDYILACVELNINVRWRPPNSTSYLTKHSSESSIEKIDEDFLIVKISESEKELSKMLSGHSEMNSVLCLDEINLPESSNAGNFQMMDSPIDDSNKHQYIDDSDEFLYRYHRSIIDKYQSDDELVKLEQTGSSVTNSSTVLSNENSDAMNFVEINESEENFRNAPLSHTENQTEIAPGQELVYRDEDKLKVMEMSNKSLPADDQHADGDFQNIASNETDLNLYVATANECLIENVIEDKESNIESNSLESEAHNFNTEHILEKYSSVTDTSNEHNEINLCSTPFDSFENSNEKRDIEKIDAQQDLLQNNAVLPNDKIHSDEIESILSNDHYVKPGNYTVSKTPSNSYPIHPSANIYFDRSDCTIPNHIEKSDTQQVLLQNNSIFPNVGTHYSEIERIPSNDHYVKPGNCAVSTTPSNSYPIHPSANIYFDRSDSTIPNSFEKADAQQVLLQNNATFSHDKTYSDIIESSNGNPITENHMVSQIPSNFHPIYPSQNIYLNRSNCTIPSQNSHIPGSDHVSQQNFTSNLLQNNRQDSNRIINRLKTGGNLYQNLNTDFKWYHAENDQHYQTSENMSKLKELGFDDAERNYRLLMKFGNNLNDVINELID